MGIFSFFKRNKREDLNDKYNEIQIKPVIDKVENEKDAFLYDFNLDDEIENNFTEEINFQRVSLTEEELDNLIVEQVLMVINNHKNFEDIEKVAAKAAANIGKEYIEKLSTYIEGKISRPSYMKDRYDGLGQWSMVVENSVLAIIYCFKQYGVDELLKIAAGSKNIRFKAINLLCKLANEGIEREKIIDSVIFIMRDLKEDDVLKILSFISQIKANHKIEKLLKLYFKKYILENKIEEAYNIILDLINNREKLTKEELTFIKSMALVEGKIDNSLILEDGLGCIDLSNLDEEVRIQAIVTFYSIKKDDMEINDRLKYLRDNSLNDELRKYLSEILSKK